MPIARQAVPSTIVFAGQECSVIAGQRFDWRLGDFFAVPLWAWHEHANTAAEEALLFSIHDTPVFEAIGLYREEVYGERGGHQPVTSVFEIRSRLADGSKEEYPMFQCIEIDHVALMTNDMEATV
jgi:hypothetical protein